MNVEKFSLGLSDPLETASGTIRERGGFLVRASHENQSGLGEATPLPGWTESLAECERALESVNPVAEEAGLQAALRELPRSATAARHGLSTALLDAAARADDVTLGRWLGEATTADRVPVNATIGDFRPAETAERARIAVEEGFDCCKLKVGPRSVDEDLERVEAVRRTVGGDVELRVDANGSWSRDEAERAIEGLVQYDVAIVEQPVAADDLDGLANLRGLGVEVAVDETLVDHSPATVVDAAAADVLVLKPMVLGGPGEAYTIALWARDRGLDVVVTTTIDAVVARTAAVHVASAIPDVMPCGLATGSMLDEDLGPDPAPVANGSIRVPDDPGLGISEVAVDE